MESGGSPEEVEAGLFARTGDDEMLRRLGEQAMRAEPVELHEFVLEVARSGRDWRVEIWEGGGFRAATEAGDIDTALRMAVPYLASSCEPDPLAPVVRLAGS